MNKTITTTDFFLLVCGVILLDIDILGKYFYEEKNHRRYLTHYPPLWVIFLLVFYSLALKELFWLTIGCLIHVLGDIIDWGIPVFPRKNSRLLPHLLASVTGTSSEQAFSAVYWNNSFLKNLEFILFIGAFSTLVFLPQDQMIVTGFFGIIVYPLSIHNYLQAKKFLKS